MKKTLIALAAVSLVISTVLLAEQGEKKDLTGVWEAKISPTGVPPPPIRALSMFRKGRQLRWDPQSEGSTCSCHTGRCGRHGPGVWPMGPNG
jgi:hypothetical protein